MTELHPTFDMMTRTWFLADGREAPSLRLLSGLLNQGETLIGWYPDGYGSALTLRAPIPAREKREGAAAGGAFVLSEPGAGAGKKKPPVPVVGAGPAIEPARERPKPTKSPKPPPFPASKWTPEQDGWLLDLVGAGLTGSQIGIRLHKSRNAIIGRCSRLGIQLKGPPMFSRKSAKRRAT